MTSFAEGGGGVKRHPTHFSGMGGEEDEDEEVMKCHLPQQKSFCRAKLSYSVHFAKLCFFAQFCLVICSLVVPSALAGTILYSVGT